MVINCNCNESVNVWSVKQYNMFVGKCNVCVQECCQGAVVGKRLLEDFYIVQFSTYIRKWFNAPVLSLPDRDASVIFMFRASACKIVKKYLKNIRWRLWRCSLAKFSRNIWKHIRWRVLRWPVDLVVLVSVWPQSHSLSVYTKFYSHLSSHQYINNLWAKHTIFANCKSFKLSLN